MGETDKRTAHFGPLWWVRARKGILFSLGFQKNSREEAVLELIQEEMAFKAEGMAEARPRSQQLPVGGVCRSEKGHGWQRPGQQTETLSFGQRGAIDSFIMGPGQMCL